MDNEDDPHHQQQPFSSPQENDSSSNNDQKTTSSSILQPTQLSASSPAFHKNYDRNLWYIHGHAYNLSPFLQKHPGGKTALILGKGRDCTNIVRTYHYTSTSYIVKRLQQYRTGGYFDPYNDYTPAVIVKDDDPFHQEVKELVNRHRKKWGSIYVTPMYLMFSIMLLIVCVGLLMDVLWRGRVSSGIILGCFAWFPAAIMSHDGAHFAYCRNAKLNRFSAMVCSPLYFNSCLWLLQHVYSHHQFTNDHERDVDLHHSFGLVRVSRWQKWKPFMKYTLHPFLFLAQLFFSTLAESVFYPVMVLLDYFFGTKLVFSAIPNKDNIVQECFLELVVELIFSVIFIITPFARKDFSFARAYALGILPFHISSVIFILATQFAHLTRATATISVNLEKKSDSMPEEEPITSIRRQVQTSLDVNPSSRLVNLVLGGLNTQSLHHVIPGFYSGRFPSIYPEYAKICEKYGVERHASNSVLWGFVEYVKYMCAMNLSDASHDSDNRQRTFTVDEVSVRKDVIVIDNVVYDIKNFKRYHPGGEVISILEGLDVSNVFYSTHRNGKGPLEDKLRKFKIGHVTKRDGGSVPTTLLRAQPEADEFLCELNGTLRHKIVPKPGDEVSVQALRVRIRTLGAWALGFAVAFVFPGMHMTVRLLGAITAAFCSCSLVGQIAHEDTHGVLRFSGKRIPNFFISTLWAMLWPLMSEPYFRFEHTTHHVDPLNPDFDYEVTGLRYFIRYSNTQPWYPWHAWQHWYGFFVYGFYIVFQTVFEFPLRFFRNFNRTYERQLLHYYNWSISLVFWYWVPKKVAELDGQTHFIMFFTFMYVWQFLLYLVAAINHAIDTDTTDVPEKYRNVWSYSVLKNTSNFCIDSKFWHWLSGGFYIQNEHHLLSWIPQEYLRMAVDTTKELCCKYNYPYNEFTSFWSLCQSHYRKLKQLGKRPSSLE